jgi:hypothetical protein
MSTIVKMPISNVLLGSDYTGAIMVGSGQVKLNVILDTGSSTLAVVGQDFNPSTDEGVTTTNIAQEVQYGSGSWVGAVVRAPVGLGGGVSLTSANLAVTYQESANMFGKAQGIWGLAYKTLNNAFRMPANTWTHKYRIRRIESGKVCDLIAYFGQLTETGVVADKFAFYTKRSIISAATGNPATDPLNQGFFIVGGGEEQNELYSGAFTHVAVLHDIYYNRGLLVQVGDRPAIGGDIRISPTSCALRLKRKLPRSFRRSPPRVSAHAGKGPRGSAPPETAWRGCTAVWTAGQSTIAMRPIARRRAEICRGPALGLAAR